MRGRRVNDYKLNKKSKKHLRYAGSLILLVFILSMLPLGSMESLALNGTITGSSSEGDTFWRGIASPTNLEISQNVTVTDDAVNLNQVYQYDASGADQDHHHQTINVKFAREGKFQPTISVEELNSHSATGSENLWKDYVNSDKYFSYVYLLSKGAITYYKVYTDDSTSRMGDVLLAYYRTNFNPASYKKSEHMMITTQENYGRILNPVVEACAKANGWIKYDGNGISLWQNETPVKRIEMITVNPLDYYYTAYNADRSKSWHHDLDMMLYTAHSYEFEYEGEPIKLEIPVVSTESGNSIVEGAAIPEDECVFLAEPEGLKGVSKIQYHLSDSKIEDTTKISWTDYTGEFGLSGKKYLYVRSYFKDGSQPYIESEVIGYEINYMSSSSAIVTSTPENGGNVDVADEIQISQIGAEEGASLFYVVDSEKAPTLTRVSYADRKTLNLDNLSNDKEYVRTDGKVYVKINGIWYLSSDSAVRKYTSSITTDEQLRVKNVMTIYVLVEDNGKELGEFQPLRFTYNTLKQTAMPETTVATSVSEPTTVKMGSTIGLLSSTTGSKIFYTTNGSAPIVRIGENGPVAGANTKEYKDSEPIKVTEEIANYGQAFLVMAQAVTYKEIDGAYYRIYQDSPVAKFNYKVGMQTPVEKVQSIPKTNADTPVEVQVGSKIQLYSDTEGVDIYYTLNGTEPLFDAETKEPGENTFKYSGTTGIVVEKSADSSLFTITAVAYKEGLAVSDISRLVFAYPAGVTSPYANPISGAVIENTEVVLKSATDGAIIYYEVARGNEIPKDPTESSKVFDESNPIRITEKTTIKAFAVKDTIESTIVTFTYTVSDKLKMPVPSIGTGAVLSSGTIISLTADEGATIYYTLDGSDPKDPTNKKVQVGSQVIMDGEPGTMLVLRTYSMKSGYSNSDVGTYSYSISAYEGGIYADRVSGETVKNGEIVHLHTDMSDAKIYYTTDGSTPTEKSRSGNSVTINGAPGEQVTIMALAIAQGSEKTTSFATFTYMIMNKLAAPTASVPNEAIFTKESIVELKAETGKIYYTTDGTDPSTSSNLYKKSIVIDKEVTIKAVAVSEDYEQSEISTFHYGFAEQVAAPVAKYASGELEMGTKVSFTCETEGATIYYRTDGGNLNLAKKNELQIYTGPITVNKAMNFKVIAVKEKMQDSKVLTVGYTVREPIVIETTEEKVQQNQESQGNRLQSRRGFSDAGTGPSYTDVVLRNAGYGAVVAAEEGTLPEEVQLVVEKTIVTEAAERRVKQVISENFGVVASYDVKLLVNGEETQPEGTIEIGLPIPVEYENAMLYIVHVQEDGNIELFETRRSGGIAYAKVDHLSIYSITAPVDYEEEKEAFQWLPIVYTLAVGGTGIGIWMIYKSKTKREDGKQDV